MTYTETAQWLSGRDDCLILTHVRPDGDTVGCAAGLCRALREQGKTAWILPNAETTELYAPYLEGLLAPVDFTPRTVVAVDIAARGLFPENARIYLDQVDLTIDHHPSQELYAARTCLDVGRAACGELVYDVIRQWGPVSARAALPLYVAVSTDTGCFVYGNTTADTHRVAAALLDTGIPVQEVNKRLFRTKSFRRLKLEARLLSQLELLDGGKTALAVLPLELLREVQAREEDLDSISALVGQIEGVVSGLTLRQLEEGVWKLSLRTTPQGPNASQVCALLGGGGHAAAAGATLRGSRDEARDAVLRALNTVGEGGG